MESKPSWTDNVLDFIYYSGAFACILSVVKYVNSVFKKEHENEVIIEQAKIIKGLMKQIEDDKRELIRVTEILRNSK